MRRDARGETARIRPGVVILCTVGVSARPITPQHAKRNMIAPSDTTARNAIAVSCPVYSRPKGPYWQQRHELSHLFFVPLYTGPDPALVGRSRSRHPTSLRPHRGLSSH